MGACFSDVSGAKATVRGGGDGRSDSGGGKVVVISAPDEGDRSKGLEPLRIENSAADNMARCYSGFSGGGGDSDNVEYQRGPNSNVVYNSSGGAQDEAVAFYYQSKGLQPLYTRIELSLSASKLRNIDINDKPCCTKSAVAVVYAKKKNGYHDELEEIGRTKVIMNNSNPIWIQNISLAFHFEVVQPLVFRVYDVDPYARDHNLSTKMLDLKDQDYVGEANCVLSEIMMLRSRSMTLKFHHKNGDDVGKMGSITIHAEETVASKMAITMRLRCSNLNKKEPFLRISRIIENGSPIPICKTEVVNNNLDPVWKPLCLTMQQYVSKDNPLVIECFDFNANGKHRLIGKLHTSIQDMENLYKANAGANFVFPHQKDLEEVLKGKLYVDGYEEKELYTFLEYISSGFELNFMVAVDFTSSNGDPQNSDSLHYTGYHSLLNAYQEAIKEVGEVVQVYNYNKHIPAWGFGGKVDDRPVSHCFNLSGKAGSFEVQGVEGLMAAYKNTLHTVSLQGPTLFGPVVNQAAEIATQSLSTNPTKYFVLLIITDGVLTDLQETKDALVRASDLPLSILIVGVGDADFKQMEILDANTGPPLESSTGKVATRDIVHFVPMHDVHHGGRSSKDGRRSMAQALLEELPGQFLTYMRSKDIKPLGIDAPQAPLPPDLIVI